MDSIITFCAGLVILANIGALGFLIRGMIKGGI